MLEYIPTLLSRLFEGVWLRGVLLGWDQLFTCTHSPPGQRAGFAGSSRRERSPPHWAGHPSGTACYPGSWTETEI